MFSGRMGVKKLIHDSKLRLATGNIGTLLRYGTELVDGTIRRVNVACLQETKRVGKNLEKLKLQVY